MDQEPDVHLAKKRERASFDQYLENESRILKATFTDGEKMQDEWRIQLPPLQFLFLTVQPIIDMRLRCKSKGKDYPSAVPCEITKVLELEMTKWELLGLDDVRESLGFSANAKGAIYPDRRATQSWIKTQFELNISFVLPPSLALVPKDVIQDIGVSVIQRLVDDKKQKANDGVLVDYDKFKREKLKNLV
ncbi:uncharacterized protein LOC126715200 isoform X6 [Quercus robur]|uniref:uncharacterized protein LOC126715200 isoform X6 n=1 Tax=Quercus robur TaxID=38942 RepID=UPI00216358FF|nr:uncharacterized protein LOC126715200 isoform X6 [Quercus robur]